MRLYHLLHTPCLVTKVPLTTRECSSPKSANFLLMAHLKQTNSRALTTTLATLNSTLNRLHTVYPTPSTTTTVTKMGTMIMTTTVTKMDTMIMMTTVTKMDTMTMMTTVTKMDTMTTATMMTTVTTMTTTTSMLTLSLWKQRPTSKDAQQTLSSAFTNLRRANTSSNSRLKTMTYPVSTWSPSRWAEHTTTTITDTETVLSSGLASSACLIQLTPGPWKRSMARTLTQACALLSFQPKHQTKQP